MKKKDNSDKLIYELGQKSEIMEKLPEEENSIISKNLRADPRPLPPPLRPPPPPPASPQADV
jgi:hypothetical protein